MKAFTLIELLMVISIIAILAAILMPAVGSVKAMAGQMVCANNQRQIMLGIIAYAQDYRGYTPPIDGWNAFGLNDGFGRPPHLRLINLGYLDNSGFDEADIAGHLDSADLHKNTLYYCKSIQVDTPNRSCFYAVRNNNMCDWDTLQAPPLNLPYCRDIVTPTGGNTGMIRISTAPQQMPFLAETIDWQTPTHGQAWSNSTKEHLQSIGISWGSFIRPVHRGRAVVAWLDGRVAGRSRTQLMTEDQILYVWDLP